MEYASNAAEEKAKLRAAVARLLHGSATRCLRAWAEYTAEQSRLEDVCRKVAARISSLAAAGAFARWRASLQTSRCTTREICHKVMSRMLSRVKAGAFDEWCVFVEKRRRERETYDRVVQLPKRRLARFGWLNWREAFHQRQQLRRAMRIMRNGVAFRALRMWRDNVDEALEHRALATRAFGFLRNRTIAGAFNRWKEFREECVELREKMLR